MIGLDLGCRLIKTRQVHTLLVGCKPGRATWIEHIFSEIIPVIDFGFVLRGCVRRHLLRSITLQLDARNLKYRCASCSITVVVHSTGSSNTTRLDLRCIQMDAKSQRESFTRPLRPLSTKRARAFLRSKWCLPRVT